MYLYLQMYLYRMWKENSKMKIEELKEKLYALNGIIRIILKECEYDKHYDLAVDYNESNADECMLYKTFSDILTHLSYSNMFLEYLEKPIKQEGIITVNRLGHYKLNRFTIKRGDCIEVLQQGDEEDADFWNLIIFGDIYKIEGKYARIRK